MPATHLEQLNQGKTILRIQFNFQKKKWYLARYTQPGGWIVHNNLLFFTRTEAENHLLQIALQFPDIVPDIVQDICQNPHIPTTLNS